MLQITAQSCPTSLPMPSLGRRPLLAQPTLAPHAPFRPLLLLIYNIISVIRGNSVKSKASTYWKPRKPGNSSGIRIWGREERFPPGFCVFRQRKVRILGRSGWRCLWGRRERFPPYLKACLAQPERGFSQDPLVFIPQDLPLPGPRLPLGKEPIDHQQLQSVRGLKRVP